jgi:hypothetical protein
MSRDVVRHQSRKNPVVVAQHRTTSYDIDTIVEKILSLLRNIARQGFHCSSKKTLTLHLQPKTRLVATAPPTATRP